MSRPSPLREPLELLKLHGTGNDFLVLIDRDGRLPVDGSAARALCDRHRGIGADGLIRVVPGPPEPAPGAALAAMELLNSDGSPAEISGNGLRCLALALVLEGVAPGPPAQFLVDTDAGRRLAKVGPLVGAGGAEVSVGMGEIPVGLPAEVAGRRARLVDMGNPHLVVQVEDPEAVDLGSEGPAEEARHPGGINVNYASVAGEGRLRLRTWERGAGATLACGSGSCATAVAFREWGLVGDRVVVDNPGGSVTVSFEPGGLVLGGAAQLIGVVQVESSVLRSMASAMEGPA